MNVYEIEQLKTQINKTILDNNYMTETIGRLSMQIDKLSKQVELLSLRITENNKVSKKNLGSSVTTSTITPTPISQMTENAAKRIPKPFGLNPVADLNNYCVNHLRVKPDYRHTALFPTGPHKIEIWLGNYKLSEYTDPQKQKAKCISASIGLGELNRFRGDLDQLAKDIYA
jgi:hypothetical protein